MMHKSSLKNLLSFKRANRWVVILTVGAALATSTIALSTLLRFRQTSQRSAPIPSVNAQVVRAVTALGRLEPEGEVIQLSAPASTERNARVEQILVKVGDKVHSGQIVAILDSRDRLRAALRQAEQQVKIAQARLAQVKAGAKPGEIAAQKAAITRLDVELGNAQIEFRRYQHLYQNGAISASDFDSKRLNVEMLQEQINEAQATLIATAEVRSVDVQAAQAELDGAILAVEQAQADLNLAYVRSPIDGQILKIHTQFGEVVSDKGIVDLGQTNQMYVVAEVYETDVGNVRLGQRATITSDTFPRKLLGTVDQIGLQIDKRDILDTDPAADVDARVVEVKIRLKSEDSQLVTDLTNLQVKVAIDI
jgi:HlyD family secretion protein